MQKKVSFWKHHPISDQSSELLAKETIEWQKRFGFDFVKITPAGSWQATCYGVVDSWENDFLGRRAITSRCVNHIEDWEKITEFKEFPTPLKIQVEAGRLVCEEIQDVPVYATVFNPITQAIQMAGIEVLKQHLKEKPAAVLKALEKITQNTILTIEAFKNVGIKGLYFVTQAQQPSFFTEEEYKKIALKWDNQCLEIATKIFQNTIYHLHGDTVFICVNAYPNFSIHFESDSINSAALNASSINAIQGLTPNKLIKLSSKRAMENEVKNNSMITCGCVLPLDFPDREIHKWLKFSRQ